MEETYKNYRPTTQFLYSLSKAQSFLWFKCKTGLSDGIQFFASCQFQLQISWILFYKISIIFLVQQIKLNNQIKIRQDRFGISCVCRQNGTEVKSHLLVTKYSASEPWRNAGLEPRSQTAQRNPGIGQQFECGQWWDGLTKN